MFFSNPKMRKMGAYYNNCHHVKDDVNKNNCDQDSTEHQEFNNNLKTPITDGKKSETQTKKVVFNLHHTFRGEPVPIETEEEAEAKRKAAIAESNAANAEVKAAYEKDKKRLGLQKRQLEAEKFCDEHLDFTNFRIPVYESDEDRVDRLTFETIKYYAEGSKYVPSNPKTDVESSSTDDDEFLKDEELDSDNHNMSK